jgi:hypothetical protein
VHRFPGASAAVFPTGPERAVYNNAIHHGGQTVAVEVGDAEHGTRRRVGRDTAVAIGSVTKCFIATTAMILVADGDLELDAQSPTTCPSWARSASTQPGVVRHVKETQPAITRLPWVG